ncbi:endonuclease III domain-containing protein [Ammonifex thiophilus]|uniref:Endonuclease III n=1 Tax=Ammonifex thiophilus TaxID=444093 RepID=A0A3D8P282_9THEO|nr:endonuclease III [Ammonifex thiophilus]RDV82307.1 endonuclease III [Ammonifex thiophilus]
MSSLISPYCELKGEEILAGLRGIAVDPRDFVAYWVYLSTRDPFAVLVATLLSQHSTDRKALEVYRRLVQVVKNLSPASFLNCEEQELAEILRPAGLHRRKAELLRALAREVVDFDLKALGNLPTFEARRRLLKLPGVGPKTADVLLLHLGHPLFPVDTHIARITNRLSWAKGSRYEEIQKVWMELFSPKDYQEVHLRLIQWGREVCRARTPRCFTCFLRICCSFAKEEGRT